jgi:hypothetical protein
VTGKDSKQSTLRSKVERKTDKWYHLAYVYSGFDGFVYVNGQLSGKETDMVYSFGIPITRLDNYFGISDDGKNVVNFQLDEIKIYSEALNQAQIQIDMNTTSGIAAGICDDFYSPTKKSNRK